jgi:hypothetical protein
MSHGVSFVRNFGVLLLGIAAAGLLPDLGRQTALAVVMGLPMPVRRGESSGAQDVGPDLRSTM